MGYDYLVVGSGLFGAVFAHQGKKQGKSVLVVEKRPNIAGNIYREKVQGINVHKYGAHIFRIIKKCGNTSRSSRSSTDSPILQLRITKENCFPY